MVETWEFPIFHAACDCELLCSLIQFSLIMLLNFSGDDPAGICHVESIQKNPLYSVDHLCATSHDFFHLYRHL